MTLRDSYPDIDERLTEWSAPKRVSGQIYEAVTRQCVGSFDEITTLPKSLRAELTASCSGTFPSIASVTDDRGCRKLLLRFADGQAVETVLIYGADDNVTVCVSSQVGCGLKCVFCASGLSGFKRNLTHAEIASQAFTARKMAQQLGKTVTNVVVMGMGEPFLNFDETIKALRLLNDPDGFALGARKMSVSTAGILRRIRAFGALKEQFNLAISLHSPFDRQRHELMPVAQGYTVAQLTEEAERYAKATNRKVFFEYLLLRDVNVSMAHIKALARLLKHPLFHVNLISYNPAAGGFHGLSRMEAESIADNMQEAGLHVTIRRSVGSSISAACGQLAAR